MTTNSTNLTPTEPLATTGTGVRNKTAARVSADSLSALLTMLALGGVIAIAGFMSPKEFITPESGIGYYLGITGSLMMVVMLIYPVRKRVRSLRVIGSVKAWFRAHMLLGVVGPTLIIVHTNFSLGSTNGQVALFCMIIVSLSGFIGRYLYRQIHHGLYGHRATLRELQQQSGRLRENSSMQKLGLQVIDARLATLEAQIEEGAQGPLDAIVFPFRQSLRTRYLHFVVMKDLRKTLTMRASESTVIAANRDRLIKTTGQYLSQRLRISRKVVMFRMYEKLFSLWHVLHIPLFLILVGAAILHIWAVHAY